MLTLFFIIHILLILLALAILLFLVYTFYAMWSAAPFVPMDKARVKRLVAFADIKPEETLMDLGSGDGRIVIEAAKYGGGTCIGIEINPVLFWWSNLKIRMKKLKNAEVRKTSLWNVDLSNVDVLTLFLLPAKMKRLREKIKREMKPGSRVVSYAFRFPEWEPVGKDGKIYQYIV